MMLLKYLVENEARVISLCELVFDDPIYFLKSADHVEGLRLEFKVFKSHTIVKRVIDFQGD